MKGVDLFCGCGGMSLGFIAGGIAVEEAYDSWQEAIDCYQPNFSHPAILADLSETGSITKRIAALNPDIIFGGPPCQDFSQAGKRQEGSRASLTECFAEIVVNVLPTWFIMENVERSKTSRAYRRARGLFIEAGYGLTEATLNAKYYGVPQNRKRFFCIGSKGVSDGFLANELKFAATVQPCSMREYFGNIGQPLEIAHYYRHPRNYSRRAVFSIDEPAPTIRGVNRPVPSGYAGHSGDTYDAQKVRPLTSRERALLQSFPADFKLKGTKTTMEQLVGNAVPVKLAEAVAKTTLAHHLSRHPQPIQHKAKFAIPSSNSLF